MRIYFSILFGFLSLVLLPLQTAAEPLTVSYFERPPYYFTAKDGSAKGFLVTRTQEILRSANIEAQFLSLSPNQIIYVLKHANTPNCSIGWFKKSERELYAQFTQPIYQNRPLVLLTTRDQLLTFKQYEGLAAIFSQRQLVMVRMSSFSYGSFVDQLLEHHNPVSYFGTKSQADVVRAIAQGKANYMLAAPEEVDVMMQSAGLAADDFATMTLSEIPAGNLRYLMCGKQVSAETMQRLNIAIERLGIK
ncbi:MAG: transporter substrate-binding domain-containing protein [Deltaproteobacteria bacterium]|jgi:polar amino acid transport system substrate-binding protein|nr:transporter substrate-binding domain-containing protein [Deltaproteobacteria bacterium]MCW8894104.1 transporter substrate-binding domain-containing protein [Deltaproteobacteria bacterium]